MNKRRVATPFIPEVHTPYHDVIEYADSKSYTKPNSTELGLLQSRIENLIDAGLWDKMVAGFWFNYGDTNVSDFSLINLKNPGDSTQASAVGSPTYYSNGWGNANTEAKYIDTNVILNDEPLFEMNDGSMAFGGTSDDYGSYWTVGATQAASAFFLTRQTRRWGGSTHQLGGLYGGNRNLFLNNVGGSLTAYLDNVLKNTNSNGVSASKPTVPFRLLGGTTNNRCRYWFCFSSLDASERTDLYNILTDNY